MGSLMQLVVILSFFAVVIAFAIAGYLDLSVQQHASENKRIIEVSSLIQAGANTFMRREDGVLARFAGVAAVLIVLFLPEPLWNGSLLGQHGSLVRHFAMTAA